MLSSRPDGQLRSSGSAPPLPIQSASSEVGKGCVHVFVAAQAGHGPVDAREVRHAHRLLQLRLRDEAAHAGGVHGAHLDREVCRRRARRRTQARGVAEAELERSAALEGDPGVDPQDAGGFAKVSTVAALVGPEIPQTPSQSMTMMRSVNIESVPGAEGAVTSSASGFPGSST